jgi:hypothetical protein
MPNTIKYSTSTQTLALKKGNFWIGTGDVGKGDTASTGYWNGITPPSGGYTIYLNKSTQGPSIYTVTSDAQLITLTNQIGSQSFTTAGDALNWYNTQTDKTVFNLDYPSITTNGLNLIVDAGFTPSYPTIGTTWYDLSGAASGGNGALTNGPTFSTAFSGGVTFDGVNDYVNFGSILTAQTTTQTISLVITIPTAQPLTSGFYTGSVFGRYGTSDFFRDYCISVWNTGNVANPSTYDIYFQTLNQAGSLATTYTLGTYAFSSTPRAFTFSENAGVCSGYTNGTYVNQASITHYTPPASTEVDMGFTNNTTKYCYFKGTINQLDYYYNVALTSAQVTSNFSVIKGRYGL